MSDPLSIWIEKKLFLETQLAIACDPSQQFTLLKQIQECDQQIQRLKNQTNFQANFHPDSKTNPQSQSNQASSLNNQPNQVYFDNQIPNNPATHLPSQTQQPQLAQLLVQPQTNQAQQLNKQNEQTYLVPSNIDKTTNTINNASVNTKYSDQLIQLLKQKFDSLKDKESMQFLLSLEDFLSFISRDNNPIKSITKSLENELLHQHSLIKNHFEIQKNKAIEIKTKLIEQYPQIDDSHKDKSAFDDDYGSPNHKRFSFQMFNKIVDEIPSHSDYLIETLYETKPRVDNLISILKIRLKAYGIPSRQNSLTKDFDKQIWIHFLDLEEEYNQTYKKWQHYYETNSSTALFRVKYIISLMNANHIKESDVRKLSESQQLEYTCNRFVEQLSFPWVKNILNQQNPLNYSTNNKINSLKKDLEKVYNKIYDEMVLATYQPQTQPLEPTSQSNSSKTPQTSNSLLPSLQTGNKSTINIGVQPNLKAISSKTFKQNQIVKNLAISKGNQSSMDNYLLNDLKEKITNNKAVLFIGTGVSISASGNNPLSSWQGLLKHGVDRCVSLSPTLRSNWKDDMLRLIGSDMTDLLSAAQQIENRLKNVGSGHYKQWLLDTIGSLSIIKPDIIDSIKSLSLPIVTTNYDELLEEGTGLREIIWNDSFQVDRFFRGEEQGIFHLHGYYRNSDSVILSFTNYQNILGSSLTQSFLQALRIGKTLIFIGCGDGLQDPNFKPFLEFGSQTLSQSSSCHYRLIKQSELATFKQYHPDGSNIFPIAYGDDYDDLAPFITSLNP